MTENELKTTESIEPAGTAEPAAEEIRLNEEIVRTLRKLNAMSRRGPRPDPELPPPPDAPKDPRGDIKREHGRGRIMAILNDGGAMSQCRLAHLLDIRPQSLSELLGKLERDGMILREKNPEDRRETLVNLTAEGRERAAVFESERARAGEAFLAPLSEEERETLAELLRRLLEGRFEE